MRFNFILLSILFSVILIPVFTAQVYATDSTNAQLLYGDDTNTDLYEREAVEDATGFIGEGTLSSYADIPEWVECSSSAFNASRMLCVVYDAETGDITGHSYNNSTDTWIDMGDLTTTSSTSAPHHKVMDITIEYTTGDALLVYVDVSSDSLFYRTMADNVDVWSGETEMTDTDYDDIFWVTLEPDPSNDDVMMCVDKNNASQTNSLGLFCALWNGSSFASNTSFGPTSRIDSALTGQYYDFAWEGNLSEGLLLWGQCDDESDCASPTIDDFADVQYETFTSGTWDGATEYFDELEMKEKGLQVSLATNFDYDTHDQIAVAIAGAQDKVVYTDVWEGSAFDGRETPTLGQWEGGKGGRGYFEIAWQSGTGNAYIANMGKTVGLPVAYYNDSTDTWTDVGTINSASSQKGTVKVFSDPNSNSLIIMAEDGKNDDDLYGYRCDDNPVCTGTSGWTETVLRADGITPVAQSYGGAFFDGRLESADPDPVNESDPISLTDQITAAKNYTVNIIGTQVTLPHGYDEVTVAETHTGDTSYTTIPNISLTSGNFTAGNKYLVMFQAQMQGSDLTANYFIKVRHGSTDFTGSEYIIEPPNASSYSPYTWFTVWTAVASEDLTMQFKTDDSGQTVTVDQLSITAIEISEDLVEDTDWYFDSRTASDSLSTTFTATNPSVTFTPNGSDDWLVMSNTQINPASTAVNYESRINLDDTTLTPLHSQEGEDITNDLQMHFLARVYTPDATSHTFESDSRVDSGTTGTREYSSIFAINLDKFDVHADAYEVEESDIPLDTTYSREVQSATIVPNGSVDVFIMSFGIFDFIDGVGFAGTYQRQQVVNVDQPPTQTSDNYLIGRNWDRTDNLYWAINTMESLSSSTTIDYDASTQFTINNDIIDNQIVAFTLKLPGTESDPISLTDQITTLHNMVNSESDPISLTDQLTTETTGGDPVNNESDPISLIDSIVATQGFINSESDPISLTDSIVSIKDFINSESDPISLTDSIVATQGFLNSESNPISLTDSIETLHSMINSESDPISITDSIELLQTLINAESDPISLTDSISAAVMFIDSESDPISLTDSIENVVSFLNGESDPISLIDSIEPLVGFVDSESDPISLIDSIEALQTRVDSESDPISLTDQLTTLHNMANSESDPISLTDSIENVVSFLNGESDPISFTDSITILRMLENSESDPISFTDSITILRMLENNESDPISFTDSITAAVMFIDAESDPVSLTDSIVATQGFLNSESDPVSLTDSIELLIMFIDSESDPISITDSITAIGSGDSYEPTGKYIWFNLSPPTADRLGGIYAFECPSGQFIYAINTNGTVSCRVP